jgi:hypothetical protein
MNKGFFMIPHSEILELSLHDSSAPGGGKRLSSFWFSADKLRDCSYRVLFYAFKVINDFPIFKPA